MPHDDSSRKHYGHRACGLQLSVVEVVVRVKGVTRGSAIALAIALVMATGMRARAQSGQAPVNPGSQGIPRGNDSQVTWVGCLMRVEKNPARPGTGDNTEEGKNESSRFVLKDASPASARNDRATREIALRTSKVNLAEHAGHQVELTGRFVDARTTGTSGGTSKGAATASTGAAQPAGGANPQNTIFEVTRRARRMPRVSRSEVSAFASGADGRVLRLARASRLRSPAHASPSRSRA